MKIFLKRPLGGWSQTVQGVMDVRLRSVMRDEGQPSSVTRSLESQSEWMVDRVETHGICLICGGLTGECCEAKEEWLNSSGLPISFRQKQRDRHTRAAFESHIGNLSMHGCLAYIFKFFM